MWGWCKDAPLERSRQPHAYLPNSSLHSHHQIDPEKRHNYQLLSIAYKLPFSTPQRRWPPQSWPLCRLHVLVHTLRSCPRLKSMCHA